MAERTDVRGLKSGDSRARGPQEIAKKRKEQKARRWDAKTLQTALSRIYADRTAAQREKA